MSDNRQDTKSPANQHPTRELLIQVGTKLFAQKGFAATTIQDIAGEASVNVSLVSYHFGGKEALFRACVESFGQQRLAIANKILSAPHSIEEMRIRLDMFTEEFLMLHIEDPNVCLLLLRDIDAEFEMIRDVFAQTLLKTFEKVVEFFTLAKDAGLVADWVEPKFVASSFFGSLVHAARFDKIAQDFYNESISDKSHRSRLRTHIVRTTLEGICKTPS